MTHSLNSFTKCTYFSQHYQVPQTAPGIAQKQCPSRPTHPRAYVTSGMNGVGSFVIWGICDYLGVAIMYALLAPQPLMMKNIFFHLEVLGDAKVLFSLF